MRDIIFGQKHFNSILIKENENMSILNEFREHMICLKKKDEVAIKKVERRVVSKRPKDRKFAAKAADIYEVFKQQVPYISTVLREFIDNPVVEFIFGRPFSEALVRSVLLDKEFVAMLMCNSLLRRTLNLGRTSAGQLKLRVYISILNFDRYKKDKACRS